MRSGTFVRFAVLALACGLMVLGSAIPLHGQAIVGEPFGVAAVRVPLSGEGAGQLYESGGLKLEERSGRALYPVVASGNAYRIVQNLLELEAQAPREVEVLFLFRGAEPLELTVYAPDPRTIRLVPQRERTLKSNLQFQRWWRAYYDMAQQQARIGDHPPLVYTYLTSMLSQRLGRAAPLLSRPEREQDGFPASLQLLLGVERLRDATLRRTIEGRTRVAEGPLEPLPAAPRWIEPALPTLAAEPVIEPMAMHVPEECFYIRFGTFDNYLWVRDLGREFGGDMARMITLRGTDPQLDKRLQRQLALADSLLMDLFGGRVASDLAIIGRDLFMREGAAVGVLFQARNSATFGTGLRQQRAEALAAEKDNGAEMETLQIAGRDVSLLSTPDNRLRSFYVVDGDYHLVATSQALVERFLAAGKGERPLGAAAEFRAARTAMPVDRNDTVFGYFSSAFFRSLFSPEYQIELERRLQAVTDIELLQLAQLAARNESLDVQTVDAWIAAGLLPRGFGRRSDGSGPIREQERVIDSLRGARGSFLPVPDVELRGATAAEAARYREQARTFQEDWRQLDPLLFAVKRSAGETKGQERILLEANISPLAEEKYGWVLALLGPATTAQVVSDHGELVSLQASVRGAGPFPLVPPHQLFVGVEDLPATGMVAPTGLLQWLRLLQTTPGYLGAWPKPGFLDRLPVWIAGRPDPDGFSQLLLGLWRWQGADVSLLSFRRDVLERVLPQLAVQEVEPPAQIRLQVRDLSQSQLVPWLNALYQQRAEQVALGNVRLLHSLSNQLGVPREQALATANLLLDTQLVNASKEDFQLVQLPGGLAIWQAPNAAAREEAPAAESTSPLLQWFRGLELSVNKQGDRLDVQAELVLQRQAAASAPTLPFFESFFPGRKKTSTPPPEKQTP